MLFSDGSRDYKYFFFDADCADCTVTICGLTTYPLAQFSSRSPGTRTNSFTLFVANINPDALA